MNTVDYFIISISLGSKFGIPAELIRLSLIEDGMEVDEDVFNLCEPGTEMRMEVENDDSFISLTGTSAPIGRPVVSFPVILGGCPERTTAKTSSLIH